MTFSAELFYIEAYNEKGRLIASFYYVFLIKSHRYQVDHNHIRYCLYYGAKMQKLRLI